VFATYLITKSTQLKQQIDFFFYNAHWKLYFIELKIPRRPKKVNTHYILLTNTDSIEI